MRILFIDNYDSFTYNVVEILRQLQEVELTIVKNDQLGSVSITDYDGMILSPGPDLPSVSGDLAPFVAQYIEHIPTLGICLGHQAIAEYFGGTLEQYENPLHGEKASLQVLDHTVLFKNIPNSIQVGLYHSWFVSNDSFPMELEVSARNKKGIIMAMRHKILPIYSVQFHPESYMSAYGREILQNFIRCL